MKLEDYREVLDRIDRQLLAVFEERMSVCYDIAKLKKEANIAILDEVRESSKLESIEKMVENKELTEYAISLFKLLLELSRQYQKDFINEDKI